MKLAPLIGILGICTSAFGWDGNIIPIQGRAQGRSLTGSSTLNDSLYTNPAGSAFVQAYSIEGTLFGQNGFSVSVLDTKTSVLGGALGYFRVGSDAGSVEGLKGSLFGRFSENVGLGIAPKTVWSSGLIQERLTDFDVGLLLRFGFLQLGATAQNLLGGNTKMGAQREFAYGARVGWEDTLFLSGSAQTEWGKWEPYQYGIGAEYVSPYYFSLKAGLRVVPEATAVSTFWSAGASFLAPKISVHYAVEFPQVAGAALQHTLGASLLM